MEGELIQLMAAGRVTIPRHMREDMKIEEGDPLLISQVGNVIQIVKAEVKPAE